jgi:hypothetical protein
MRDEKPLMVTRMTVQAMIPSTSVQNALEMLPEEVCLLQRLAEVVEQNTCNPLSEISTDA